MFCEVCLHGKLNRGRAQKDAMMSPTTTPLEILHLDLAGPFADIGHDGERFYLVIVCAHTGYIVVEPIVSKDVVADVFAKFLKHIRAFGSSFDKTRVQRVRADRGPSSSSAARTGSRSSSPT